MRGPAGGPWVLFERYGDKKRVSRSISKPINVDRAIGDGEIACQRGRPERARAASAALFGGLSIVIMLLIRYRSKQTVHWSDGTRAKGTARHNRNARPAT